MGSCWRYRMWNYTVSVVLSTCFAQSQDHTEIRVIRGELCISPCPCQRSTMAPQLCLYSFPSKRHFSDQCPRCGSSCGLILCPCTARTPHLCIRREILFSTVSEVSSEEFVYSVKFRWRRRTVRYGLRYWVDTFACDDPMLHHTWQRTRGCAAVLLRFLYCAVNYETEYQSTAGL